jgi:hypothetical protein
MRGLKVWVQSMSIGIQGGSACQGVCIAAGVVAVGGCEWRTEKGVCGGPAYVVSWVRSELGGV